MVGELLLLQLSACSASAEIPDPSEPPSDLQAMRHFCRMKHTAVAERCFHLGSDSGSDFWRGEGVSMKEDEVQGQSWAGKPGQKHSPGLRWNM